MPEITTPPFPVWYPYSTSLHVIEFAGFLRVVNRFYVTLIAFFRTCASRQRDMQYAIRSATCSIRQYALPSFMCSFRKKKKGPPVLGGIAVWDQNPKKKKSFVNTCVDVCCSVLQCNAVCVADNGGASIRVQFEIRLMMRSKRCLLRWQC